MAPNARMLLRFAVAAPLLLAASASSATILCNLQDPVAFCTDSARDIPAQTLAKQLIYSPAYHTLSYVNSASAVVLADTVTRISDVHLSNARFVDQSLSPSGRYVFLTDDGFEPAGTSQPFSTHLVHRADLATRQWEQRVSTYFGGRIEAVADDQVILQTTDQWVAFTYNVFGPGPNLQIQNPNNPPYVGWSCACYSGDSQFDRRSGRLIHGNSSLSSNEIRAISVSNTRFSALETSGSYGSAQDGGGSSVLATDGSVYYYGALQVDAHDVRTNLRTFPEIIVAATGKYAFGDGAYYDARTGQKVGTLPFATRVYGLNPDGDDFWAYDAASNTLRYFTLRGDAVFADSYED